ncbi:MAG: hypothetical protein OXH52_01560 [Gammaproteobacteria bacterium]|nr:hypothetical protein [Gammaproteobacteria bacterium]
MSKLDDGVLEALRALDTPTVCNALEAVAPGRRSYGFTVQPLVCTRPELGSMVGFARTAVIRAMHPADISDSEMRALREGYYAYIDGGPKPSIAGATLFRVPRNPSSASSRKTAPPATWCCR